MFSGCWSRDGSRPRISRGNVKSRSRRNNRKIHTSSTLPRCLFPGSSRKEIALDRARLSHVGFRDPSQVAEIHTSDWTSLAILRHDRWDSVHFPLDTLRRAGDVGLQYPRHAEQRAEELHNGAWPCRWPSNVNTISASRLLIAPYHLTSRNLQDIINEHKQRYVRGNEADFIDMFLYEIYNNEEQEDKVPVFSGTVPRVAFYRHASTPENIRGNFLGYRARKLTLPLPACPAGAIMKAPRARERKRSILARHTRDHLFCSFQTTICSWRWSTSSSPAVATQRRRWTCFSCKWPITRRCSASCTRR